jgi:hypothetical protein
VDREHALVAHGFVGDDLRIRLWTLLLLLAAATAPAAALLIQLGRQAERA